MKKNSIHRNLLTLFIAFSFIFPSFAAAQTATKAKSPARRAAENITAKQMSDYLHFIASDEMEGRDTPSRGLDTTAKFIGMNLSRWGFKPAGDDGTFYQKIALRRDVVDGQNTSVVIGGQKFAYGEDFLRASGSDSGAVSSSVVYAGNGWLIKSKNLNPYQGLDVKGKYIAVLGEGEITSPQRLVPLPAGVTAADLTGTRGTDWADAATYARQNGAKGVIILPSKFLQENWETVRQLFGRNRMYVEKLAPVTVTAGATPPSVFLASTKVAQALFNAEAVNPTTGVPAVATDLNAAKKIDFNIKLKPEIQMTQNVVAIWEGSDTALKNEMVAVGAHYDHVGMNPNAPGADKIWNGADDDGSGTTGVLAIAEALSMSAKRPKRSILFVWHAGEEKGLWGSEYFTKFPTVDLKNVVAQLNIDMIGRSQKPGNIIPCDKPGKPCNENLSKENEIFVIGSEMMSSKLGEVTKSVNDAYLKMKYDYRYDDPTDKNRFFFRSDHFNYAVKGIPIAFWFDGVHEDYHGAGDTADKIDYNKMQAVTRTIFLTMWELADLKTRPAIDKQLPPELMQR